MAMTRKKRINLTLNEKRENLNLYEYVNGEKPQEYILNQYEILKKTHGDDIDVYASRGYFRKIKGSSQACEYFIGKKEDIYELIQSNTEGIGLHELIKRDDVTKMYIDYESKTDNLEKVEYILKRDFGEDIQLNITDGSRVIDELGNYKYSYHIVAENRHFCNHTERLLFKQYLETTNVVIDDFGNTKTMAELGCDISVYNNNKLMRCVNNSKKERVRHNGEDKIITTNPLKIMTCSYSMNPIDHLIKTIKQGSKNVYELMKITEKKPKIVKKDKETQTTLDDFKYLLVDKNCFSGKIYYDDIERRYNNVCSPFIYCNSNIKFKGWYSELSNKMRMYYIYNKFSFEEYWELRKLKTEFLYKVDDELHEEDKLKQIEILNNELIRKKAIHYEKWNKDKTIHKTILEYERIEANIIYKVKEFIEDYDKDVIGNIYRSNLTVKYTKDIKRIELCCDDIDLNISVTYLSTDMGTGKSKCVYELVRKLYLNKKIQSFLFLTSRTNLTSNIMVLDNVKNGGLGIFSNYQDCKTDLNDKKFLSICINSVYKLKNNYEFICIDESEIIFSNFCINDIKKTDNNDLNNLNSSNTFFKLIENCKKIICCDALSMNTSISWINSIRKTKDYDYEIIGSSVRRDPIRVTIPEFIGKSDIFLPKCEITIDKTINQIVERLNNNKKIFIYWSFITPNFKNTKLSRITQENLINTIIERGANIGENDYIRHNSQENKDVLKDVNEVWASKKLVVVNSSVAVGTSYENKEKPFDYVYIFHSTTTAIPRDVAQVIKRCRQLTTDGGTYLIPIKGFSPNASFKKWIMADDRIQKQAREIFFQNLAGRNLENLYFTLERANYILNHIEISDRNMTLSDTDTIRPIDNVDIERCKIVNNDVSKYLFENIKIDNYEIDEDNSNKLNETNLKFDKLKFIRYFTKDYQNGDKCLNTIGALYNIKELKNLTIFLNKQENINDYNKIRGIDFINNELNQKIKIEDFNNQDMKILIKTLKNTKFSKINKNSYAYVIQDIEFLTNEDKTYMTKKLIRHRKNNTSLKITESYLNIILGFGFVMKSGKSLYYINKCLEDYDGIFNKVKDELNEVSSKNMFITEDECYN